MHIMTGLLGAAVGMAIAAVIWAVVVSLRKKRSGDAPQFDERQLAARAKAYSSAFSRCSGISPSWRCSIRSPRCAGLHARRALLAGGRFVSSPHFR